MMETVKLGPASCDFISQEDFLKLCQSWLTGGGLHHIVTLNPEMVMLAVGHSAFRRAVASADIRVPDGAGIIWAQWYIRSQFWSLIPSLAAFSFRHIERITGIDTIAHLSKLAAAQGKAVYLLGGMQAQARGTARYLKQKFPNLLVYTSADHTFDLRGPSDILEDINEKRAEILLVAYGAPAQTLWIEKNRSRLSHVHIAIGVGGAFAILSEEKPRAPRLLRQLNLEWSWRLLLEPSRLPRIWQAVVAFPRLIHQQKRKSTRYAP
jgi:N-acetylglucosaminyldiphosphoundecaprenol N-acetyl-beta-D-mannosaminyltransferase